MGSNSINTAMEDPPICSGCLCRLCHGDFKTDYQKQFQDVPSYAKPTAAAMRRAIAIHISTPPKSPAKDSPSKTKLGFEDLPAEIRLQIYRASLQPPNIPSLNVLISAWVKGGGLHADRSPSRYSPLMHMHASHSFPRNILVLNKRIHGEALLEIYRNITFRIAPFVVQSHIPQIKYWLTAHPMRFTSCLELPVAIMIGNELRTWEYKHCLQTKVLTIDHFAGLTRLFSRMPNLKHFNLILVLTPDFDATSAEAIKGFTKRPLWMKRLSALRAGLPSSCKATIIVKADSGFSRATESVRLEASFVKLLRSTFNIDAFEVRHYSASDGTYGVSRHGLLLQLISDYA